MPPRQGSRYTYSNGYTDADGALVLGEPEPFRFRELPDTIVHSVREGETLFTLAGRYYAAKPRAAGYWWVIADFQPDPIIDPTIALVAGSTLLVPSLRALDSLIFNEARRREIV